MAGRLLPERLTLATADLSPNSLLTYCGALRAPAASAGAPPSDKTPPPRPLLKSIAEPTVGAADCLPLAMPAPCDLMSVVLNAPGLPNFFSVAGVRFVRHQKKGGAVYKVEPTEEHAATHARLRLGRAEAAWKRLRAPPKWWPGLRIPRGGGCGVSKSAGGLPEQGAPPSAASGRSSGSSSSPP